MILMDTCAIIWDALNPEKLTPTAQQAIDEADNNNELFICDISFWEISMLVAKKRLEIEGTTTQFLNLFIQARDVKVLAITPEIAELSLSFEKDINNDPADRIIAATSIFQKLNLVTADNNLIHAPIISTIW